MNTRACRIIMLQSNPTHQKASDSPHHSRRSLPISLASNRRWHPLGRPQKQWRGTQALTGVYAQSSSVDSGLTLMEKKKGIDSLRQSNSRLEADSMQRCKVSWKCRNVPIFSSTNFTRLFYQYLCHRCTSLLQIWAPESTAMLVPSLAMKSRKRLAQSQNVLFFYLFFNNCVCVCMCVCVCVCIGNCIVPKGFLPWEIRVAFPGESQLWQRCTTQPMMHAGCFSVSIIHWTLTWTMGSLACTQMKMHWKLTQGEKSLAALGNWTCIGDVQVRCSTTWATFPPTDTCSWSRRHRQLRTKMSALILLAMFLKLSNINFLTN